MPTRQEWGDALRHVSELAEETNHPIIGEIEGETDDGEDVSGYLIEHGDHRLAVFAPPSDYSFEMRYEYDVRSDLMVAIARQQNPDQEEVEVTDELRDAATTRLQSIIANEDESDIAQLQFALVTKASFPRVGIQIVKDLGAPHGIQMNTKLFPYDPDTLTRPQFQAACQRTVTAGNLAQTILRAAYNIQQDVEGLDTGAGPGPDEPGSRGFQ